MMTPLRIGILGCGRIVRRRMLPACRDLQEARVWAVASERDGVAAEVAREFVIPRAFHSYDALLADPEIDAVYVPCTGDLHPRWTVAAAEAGKHVLCEKPLAHSYREAEEMQRACERNGVLLQEAFMWRHHPRAARVLELVRDGTLGALRLIVVSFSFNLDPGDWRMRPERGGGAMWDLGCYGVNFCRMMTQSEPLGAAPSDDARTADPPDTIVAAAHWGPTGVDLTMRIGLTFPGDVQANIDCSFETAFRCRAELLGTNGRIVLESAFQPDRDFNIWLWRSPDRDAEPEIIQIPEADQYACQVRDFCRSIRSGRLLPPAENGLENMRVLQQVLDRARAAAHIRRD